MTKDDFQKGTGIYRFDKDKIDYSDLTYIGDLEIKLYKEIKKDIKGWN